MTWKEQLNIHKEIRALRKENLNCIRKMMLSNNSKTWWELKSEYLERVELILELELSIK